MPVSPYLAGNRPLYILGPLALILTHFALVMCFFSPAISTPDANSYFGQARTLAEGGATYAVKSSPIQYVGVHYVATGQGRYYCSHAPGLGVILAVPYRLLGPLSAFWLNPILCSLSLLGLFLLGRLWLGERYAPWPVAFMAVNPMLNEHALFGDAHVAVCFLMIWSLYLFARLESRPTIWGGLAAGFLAGMIPAVRYAEAAYLPAVACYALWRRRHDQAGRRALAAAAAAGVLPLLALGLRNHGAYGAFWRTGYAPLEGPALFSSGFLLRNGPAFLHKLLGEGAGLSFALGAAAIGLMCARRGARARGLLLAGVAAPSTLLYASYYWPPDPQSMRFLLPTFFLYALATAWLLRFAARRGKTGPRTAVALLLLHACWGLPRSLRAMAMQQRVNMPLARAAAVLRRAVPQDSVLIAPGALDQYLDVLGGWRLVDAGLAQEGSLSMPPQRLEAGPGMAGGLPEDEDVGPPERPFASESFPGQASRLPRPQSRPDLYAGLGQKARFAAFRADVRRWSGEGKKAYWVMTRSDLEDYRALSPAEGFRIVARLEIPGGLPGLGQPPRGLRRRSRPEPQDLGEFFRASLAERAPLIVEWTAGPGTGI